MSAATVLMPAPAPYATFGAYSGNAYTADSEGRCTVSAIGKDISEAVAVGWRHLMPITAKVFINSALPADLVSVVSAAAVANGAATIAAQPVHARKLQYRFAYTSGAVTATYTTVGFDQDGNAITEVGSVAALAASKTIVSAYAWSQITSITLSGVSGTFSCTFGVGVSNDFGVPTASGSGLTTPSGFAALDLALLKSTKITKVLGASNTAADDAAGSATVDTSARTVAPTTAPAANGLVDFEFTYSYKLAV
jgi:hypothetical protein